MRFGELMRQKRQAYGLTLEALARKVRSHKGYVSGIENGKVNPPSWRMVRKLARVFGLEEIPLQLMAWSEKAPKVCQREAALLLEAGKGSGCACVVEAGQIKALCGLHHGSRAEAREAAAKACEVVAARIPKGGPAHYVALECAQVVRESR